jgi:hypothetical protein
MNTVPTGSGSGSATLLATPSMLLYSSLWQSFQMLLAFGYPLQKWLSSCFHGCQQTFSTIGNLPEHCKYLLEIIRLLIKSKDLLFSERSLNSKKESTV